MLRLPLVLTLLSFLPRVLLSHLFGVLARLEHPHALARASIRLFLWLYPQIDREEMVRTPLEYPTLNAFFTRTIRPEARGIAAAAIVAPCDGTYGQSGPIEDGRALQAKGISYPIEAFLADPALAEAYRGGFFVTIYLAPYNYHRVHAPADGKLVRCGHVAGDLWPVHAKAVARIPRLFCLNERSWVEQETSSGRILSCLVGAMNVGRITLSHDRAFGREAGVQIRPEKGVRLSKGQEIGIFEMGSTVVVLLDAKQRAQSQGAVPPAGTPARLGEALFRP